MISKAKNRHLYVILILTIRYISGNDNKKSYHHSVTGMVTISTSVDKSKRKLQERRSIMKTVFVVVLVALSLIFAIEAFAGKNNYSATTRSGNTVIRSNTSVNTGKYSNTYTTRTNTYHKGKQVGTSTSRVTVKNR